MTKFGTLNEEGIVENEMVFNLNEISSSDPLAFTYWVYSGRSSIRKNNKILAM